MPNEGTENAGPQVGTRNWDPIIHFKMCQQPVFCSRESRGTFVLFIMLPSCSRHQAFGAFAHLEFRSSCPRGKMGDDFYCRYYIGHKGKFGHEFMEFEITSDGKLRYANNSNYKNDVMIRKEVYVGQSVIDEVKRIVTDSEVTAEDDNNWPQPDRVGRQELEIKLGKEHISFTVGKLHLFDVRNQILMNVYFKTTFNSARKLDHY